LGPWLDGIIEASEFPKLVANGDLPLVSAVMPCLDEERTLPLCIEKAQRAFER